MFDLRLKNDSGFTLVEVLVTTLIFTSVLGVMYGMQIAVNDLFNISKEQANLQAEARLVLDFMSAELRNATRTSTQNPSPNLSIPSQPNNKSIMFYLPEDKDSDGLITDVNGDIEWATNKAVHYQFVPGQKKLRRLKPQDNIDKTLTQNVFDVQFIDAGIDASLDINELRIILTLRKTAGGKRDISFMLTSIVKLRN